MENPARRTIDQKLSGEPLKGLNSSGTMIKPVELIDVAELVPLTLADRRTWDMLIVNAWDRIGEDVEHVIALKDLRGSHNVNDRVQDSIERLMGAIVRLRIQRDGKPATMRVQLLGVNTMHDGDGSGLLYYRFPPELHGIILSSTSWGRLRTEVMFCFSSKYAYQLYQMVQRRGNLTHKRSEEFSISEIRDLLGVQKGKLARFADLNRRCLEPAVVEVNALADHHIRLDPVQIGRRVAAVRLTWFPKDEQGLKSAYAELQKHRAGRKARITDNVDVITTQLRDDLSSL
jgi:hypothetical protein